MAKQQTTGSVFNTLSSVDLSNKVENKLARPERKEELSYVPWADAWAAVCSVFEDVSYEVEMFNGLPYVYDPNTGYMVFTSVTIQGKTHKMWLPVMDGTNKAMKAEAYTYSTKYAEKTVEGATMFDINKTIMRCLVKNLAMFGLGISIYAGEDVDDAEPTETKKTEPKEYVLEVGDENWAKVLKYVEANKNLGLDAIVQQLSRKYTITDATKAEIKKHL